MLAEHGADLHILDSNGNNVIMRLVESELLTDTDIADYYLGMGLDINAQNHLGDTLSTLRSIKVYAMKLICCLDFFWRAELIQTCATKMASLPLSLLL